MLNTPLTKLRKAAPGSLTLEKLEQGFARKGLPRDRRSVGAFERAQYKTPPELFIKVYAELIGQSVTKVRAALRETQKLRGRGIGPFGGRRAA